MDRQYQMRDLGHKTFQQNHFFHCEVRKQSLKNYQLIR